MPMNHQFLSLKWRYVTFLSEQTSQLLKHTFINASMHFGAFKFISEVDLTVVEIFGRTFYGKVL